MPPQMPPLKDEMPEENPTEAILEGILLNQDENANEQRVISEAQLQEQANTTEAVQGLEPALDQIVLNTVPKEVQKIQIVPTEDENELATTFYQMLRGKPGKTPVKGEDYYTEEDKNELIEEIVPRVTPVLGKDYFTPEEQESFAREILEDATPVKGIDYIDGEDGYTPVKGVDYFDGEPGKDAEVDVESIVSRVTAVLPPPIPGKPGKAGKNGSPDSPKDIVSKLSSLEGADRLSLSSLKDTEFLRSVSSRDYDLTELKDVAIASPTNDQVLKYNSTTNKWENGTGGSSSPLTTKGDLYGFSTLDARVPVGANGTVLTADSTEALGVKWAANGTGDVVGPASSTDNAIVRFDGTTGKLIQNYTSGAPTISDTGAVNIPLTSGNSLVVDTSTFVVDATNNRVGILTASPTQTFAVNLGLEQVYGVDVDGVATFPHALATGFSYLRAPTGRGFRFQGGSTTLIDFPASTASTLVAGYAALQIGNTSGAGTSIYLNSIGASDLNLRAGDGNVARTADVIISVKDNQEVARFTDTGNVGIGTATPGAKLDIVGGNLDLDNTTNANQFGVLSKAGTRFLHDFNYGNNGTVTTIGHNLFLGEAAGNLTAGSTATETYEASQNTGVGWRVFEDLTTGFNNVALGDLALPNLTSGYQNMAVGSAALLANTTGYNNAAIGFGAMIANTTGALNSAFGYTALAGNLTGDNNTAFGLNAGRYLADGSTPATDMDNSLFLGGATKAVTATDVNTIVIGYNAQGLGSNSVVLGNDLITKTALKGSVGIGNTSPSALLTLGTAGTKAGTLSLAGGTSGVITLQTAAAAGTYTLTLPTTDGAANEFLQTDGSGVLTWAVPAGTGANTALSNLASVAINTALLPGANNTIALGAASTAEWSDIFLGEGAVINWDNGDATLTQAGDVVTLAGADLKVSSPGNVSTSVLTTDGVQTTSGKRNQPRTASSTSNANLDPDLATANVYFRTTQTTGLTIGAPTGTPVIGETIAIYVDSAGAQTLTMNATYVAFGSAFPATTTAGKQMMIVAQYTGSNWATTITVAV